MVMLGVEVYFDGMGWLPIDVTPGYYYDVYTLMNMVATPQGEKSQTNIKKDIKILKSVDDGRNGGMINDLIDHVGNLGMMSLGVLTIVCVVIFIIWILLELLRLILNIGAGLSRLLGLVNLSNTLTERSNIILRIAKVKTKTRCA